ncbi:hypothetical protein BKA62DRAFT_580773, partial [Auriculariales sp. MPI-PUGE-AT-0066]
MRVIEHPEGAESFGQKGLRKMKEQPLVPLGVVATTVAIIGATNSMLAKKRNKADFNRWLRFRIIAQGFTVAACVAGTYVFGMEAKRQQALKQESERQFNIEKERLRFADAMARAEAMQRLEDEGKAGKLRAPATSPKPTDPSTTPASGQSSWLSW